MNPFKKYADKFTEGKFWTKLKDYAKQAGVKAVYSALLLFYAFALQCFSTVAVTYKETKSVKWTSIQFARPYSRRSSDLRRHITR